MISGREYSVIGVDIAPRTMSLVQLQLGGSRPRLAAHAVVPRAAGATPEQDAALAAGICRRRGFVGRRVVVAAPQEKLISHELELPGRASGAPIEKLAAAELGRLHKLDPQALQVAAADLPLNNRGGDGSRYLATALPFADGEAVVTAFERAGLWVSAIDVRIFAMARACGSSVKGASGREPIVPVLCLEPDGHTLAAVWRGEAVYERKLEATELKAIDTLLRDHEIQEPAIYGDLVRGQCVNGFDLEPELAELSSGVQAVMQRHVAELLTQLRLSLAYVAQLVPDTELEGVTLIGELADVQPIVKAVGETLALKVNRLTLADVAEIGGTAGAAEGDLGRAGSAAVIAAGLALHEAQDGGVV